MEFVLMCKSLCQRCIVPSGLWCCQPVALPKIDSIADSSSLPSYLFPFTKDGDTLSATVLLTLVRVCL